MAILVRNDGAPISGLPEIGMMERSEAAGWGDYANCDIALIAVAA